MPDSEEPDGGSIKILESLKPNPVPEVVSLLEELLTQAYKGEIRSVAVAYIQPSVSTIGNASFWSQGRDKLTLIGAMRLCENLIMKSVPGRFTPKK